ncbi:GDP-mannose 4,6-dehydratase [Limibacter armeniacum]|uniref:GDP-mannose 4,6-dehydratase n=1 Tax=Limibacter armeniacum TaxID=466084 RepID=UPI002FE59C5A
MRVLITGVAGFIGSYTAMQLLEQGHEVTGVDNLNNYYDIRIKKFRLDSLLRHERFTFYPIDVENHISLKSVFAISEFEAVINLAARAGVRYSLKNPFIYASTNYMGSLNLLDLMQQYKVKRYVMASTSSIYAGCEVPYREDAPVNAPISPYAATKKAAELIAYTYANQFELEVAIVRYFTVYGPAGRPDMSVLRFIRWIDQGMPIQLFGDGSQARDFTYIGDIARGTVQSVLKPLSYEIINLGAGNQPVSMLTLIEHLEEMLGKKAVIDFLPFHSADIDTTWASIDKARELLDWTPEVSLEEGLRHTVNWYLDNKYWLDLISF